jgi:hypothetical protein
VGPSDSALLASLSPLRARKPGVQSPDAGRVDDCSGRCDQETVSAGPAGPAGPSQASETGTLVEGEIVARRYRIANQLGRGGSGSVYRGFDRVTREWVAIKVLDANRCPGLRSAEQLYRELRVSRAISHPNVCRIHDVVADGQRWLLTMEYASRGTLRATLEREGTERALDARLADAKAVIAGLVAIHRAGLIHRDLKPENVLRMADGRLTLSDFGLARPREQTTVTTGLTGTPAYLAPEMLVGARPSQAADVWALGVLLHEILEGRRPDWARSLPTPRLRASRASDPKERDMARVCAACLQNDPRRRPGSAIQVERLLRGGPRRRRQVGWAGLMLGLAVLGTMAALGDRHDRSSRRPTVGSSTLPTIADWSQARRLLAGESGRCWQALPPDGRVIRALVMDPPRLIEIDVETGTSTNAPVVAEAYRDGCPTLSPDRRSMLWTRRSEGRRQVMLSLRPDGALAAPLVAGSKALWLPPGRELLFVTESQRLARANLKGEVTLFGRDGASPHEIVAVSSDERGQLAAAIADYERPSRERRLELYDVQAMTYLRGHMLEGHPDPASLTFDPRQGIFLTSVALGGGQHVAAGLGPVGELVTLGRIPGVDVLHVLRAGGGLVLGTFDRNAAWFLVDDGGSERPLARGLTSADASRAGDVVFAENPHASSRGRIWLRRAGSPDRLVAEGPGLIRPDISDDGRSVVYYRQPGGEFFHCPLAAPQAAAECVMVHVDVGLQGTPPMGQIGPDGDTIPYFAIDADQSNAPVYLRVLTLSLRRVRDLGHVDPRCPPAWASARSLWIGRAGRDDWTEIEVDSGRPTGRSWLAEGTAGACSPFPPGPSVGQRFRREQTWSIRFLSDQGDQRGSADPPPVAGTRGGPSRAR